MLRTSFIPRDENDVCFELYQHSTS